MENYIKDDVAIYDTNQNYNGAGGFHRAAIIVEQIAAEYNNGWIPCNEELPPQPEENPVFDNKPLELYLASVKGADYPFRVFWNGKFFTDGFGKVDVIAWQPLPKPMEV